MRLLNLYIGQYRVLSQLGLCFDPEQFDETAKKKYHLDFLVGVNGTGKSTVLRLLGRIFSGVQQSFDALSDVPFILEYYLERTQQKVRIATVHPGDEKTLLQSYFVSVAQGLKGKYETDQPDEAHLKEVVESVLLPERIIAYTTGHQDEWFLADQSYPTEGSSLEAAQEMSPVDRALRELPGWVVPVREKQEGVEPRFRFIWQNDLVLVALSGLLLHTIAEGESPLAGVLDETKIERLVGFSLQFDLSYAGENERRDIWQRFGQYATRAIRNGGKILLVFDLTDQENIKEMLAANGGALAFYEQLADWYRTEPKLLSKVSLFLERSSNEDEFGVVDTPPLHTWDWLSDGERSFLGRMCLFMLFGEVESLILLDEPEVHFNDYWKRHIVSMMHQVFEKKNAAHKSHVLIATHSSISLSDVHPEDILILERQNLFTSQSASPRIETFGADPSEIMVHVFGTDHASGEYSVHEVERWLSNAYQIPERERRTYLDGLAKKVAPGYWAYRIRREMVGLPLQ